MTLIFPVLFIGFLLGSFSSAQATDLYALGNGQDKCSGWVQLRQNEAVHEGQVKWILGFLTGSNYRTEGQGSPADSAAVEAFVDQYCQNNPSHQLFMAAAALVQESGGPIALHQYKK